LHEQDLAVVVPNDGGDGHLGRDVPGDALADLPEPVVDDVAAVDGEAGGDADVGGDGENLLEALLLVEALGEPESRPGDAGERLAPPQQVRLGDPLLGDRLVGHGRRPYRSRIGGGCCR
jgi:hypothetical protein